MSDSKLLTSSLIVLCAISFGAESCGYASARDGGWKASSELVDSLSKQRTETNYREQKVPKYTLPDPMAASDGKKVTDAVTWQTKRRAEVLELFQTHVYGRTPVGRPKNMTFEVFDFEQKALAGSAIRKQVRVNLLYLPNTGKTTIHRIRLIRSSDGLASK